jgi:hypothetical protein
MPAPAEARAISLALAGHWFRRQRLSGYSSVAINKASGRKTALQLLDAMHLFLSGTLPLRDVILRLRRHASLAGQAVWRRV